jgi:hypothetical protein
MSAFKLALCLIADKHNAPADVMTIIGKDVVKHQAFAEVLKKIETGHDVLTPYYERREVGANHVHFWNFWESCDHQDCQDHWDMDTKEEFDESILFKWSRDYEWETQYEFM